MSLIGEEGGLHGLAESQLGTPLKQPVHHRFLPGPPEHVPHTLAQGLFPKRGDLSALSAFSEKVRPMLPEPVMGSKVRSTLSPWFQGLTVSC